MNNKNESFKTIIRYPGAWIPILIPAIFFAYLVIYIAIFGIIRNEDEGTAAHLFQLWLVLEPFLICFFAVKWLRQAPKPALLILMLQIAVAFLPISVVFLLKL